MQDQVCHYALLRFLPYREAGEFVNIGVVLACPARGYLDFAIERKKFKRVTDFFPELKKNTAIYRDGLRVLDHEFERFRLQSRQMRQLGNPGAEKYSREVFTSLIQPREALFHFSTPRTLLAEEPATRLRELFETYVERQIATTTNGPEEHLRRQMQTCLQKFNLGRFYKQDEVGNETYSVRFPFVASEPRKPNTALKAIKPLNLALERSGDVYQHGDDWLARVRRLSNMNILPQDVLFAVKKPLLGTPQERAATEICDELARFKGVAAFDFEATPKIIHWAQISFEETVV